jgi:hypothetical protein
MSNASPDTLSTLEETLEIEQDIHDEKTALVDLEDTLDELIEETRSTLDNLDEEELKMIREAFDRSLSGFFEGLVADSTSFEPGEFEDELEEFVADFRSVLHHPEAEKTVEDIEDWLVNAGTGPLNEDVREELIDVVKQDVERVNSAIDTTKTALESINADGGTVHTSVARLVKGELADVGNVDRIDTIADEMEDIAERWPYPWNSDLPEPLGSDVRTRIDDLLFNRIQSVINEANAFEQFTTLVRERILEADETLSDAGDVVSELHGRYELLTEVSVGSPTDTGQEELENRLRAAETVDDVVTGCREVLSIFDVMNDVATESVSRFRVPNSTKSLNFIQASLSRIDDKHRDLLTTRDRILSGDIEDYDEAQEGFSELIENAEQELKTLRNRIEHEIQTGKELAEIFGIDEKAQSLNEVELAASRADTVEDLVHQARECRTIRTKITDIITEDHLDPTQASVFEFILDRDTNKETNSDVIKSISDDLEMDQTEVLGVIHHLKEEGLVSISIKGA